MPDDKEGARRILVHSLTACYRKEMFQIGARVIRSPRSGIDMANATRTSPSGTTAPSRTAKRQMVRNFALQRRSLNPVSKCIMGECQTGPFLSAVLWIYGIEVSVRLSAGKDGRHRE